MIRYYGIRHHGPGSARSVLNALIQHPPDIILVEGPPDAESALSALVDTAMRPPVAILIYAEDEPSQAAYFPFVRFSPEYQTIRFALERDIPVRLMDLPQRYMLPLRAAQDNMADRQPLDPLGELARAAGYDDTERWWDALVEQRQDSSDLFEAIHETMVALREDFSANDEAEQLREAYMRQVIDRAQAEGFQNIAVICGAWHTPALKDCAYTCSDIELLKTLASVSVAVTWVPWTYSRLSRQSGYGAGVQSPGWYRFLWDTDNNQAIATGWMTKIAQHLRDHDLNASTAQVIDAVRLVETLTALRGRSLPDLHDLNEAALSVLCHGNDVPMQIIHRDLIVGKAMGRVPDNVPTVPLQRDFQRQLDRFELALSEDETDCMLDLRDEHDREISRLLYRLQLLDVLWGTQEDADIVYELWTLQWDPAFVIQLIEKGAWGNTIVEASTALALHQGREADTLPELTQLVERVLLAHLVDAIPEVMKHLADRAATTGDITQLMTALPTLVHALVYGDVRHTHQSALRQVIDGMVPRVMIGLPAECVGLDDDRAAAMKDAVIACDVALRLLEDSDTLDEWCALLARLSEQNGVHSLIRGRCCRIALDTSRIGENDTVRLMRLALARIVAPPESAAWLRGFLEDSAAVLIHDDTLLDVIDTWVSTLSVDDFEMILPLLRRTFSTFEEPEIRDIGHRIDGKEPRQPKRQTQPIDEERAGEVDKTMRELLGWDSDDGKS